MTYNTSQRAKEIAEFLIHELPPGWDCFGTVETSQGEDSVQIHLAHPLSPGFVFVRNPHGSTEEIAAGILGETLLKAEFVIVAACPAEPKAALGFRALAAQFKWTSSELISIASLLCSDLHLISPDLAIWMCGFLGVDTPHAATGELISRFAPKD